MDPVGYYIAIFCIVWVAWIIFIVVSERNEVYGSTYFFNLFSIVGTGIGAGFVFTLITFIGVSTTLIVVVFSLVGLSMLYTHMVP